MVLKSVLDEEVSKYMWWKASCDIDFFANNPDYNMARDIVKIRRLKANLDNIRKEGKD